MGGCRTYASASSHSWHDGMKSTMRVERMVIDERLAWYREDAAAGFWDEHWHGGASEEFYQRYKAGALDEYEDIFLRFLLKEGKILEAGCGLGQYVVAMRARGYDMEGVDSASETIDEINKLFGDVPIRNGDITKLDTPDGYYSGYVSLGVVEHCITGPEPFFMEAARVVSPGGVLVFTVPQFGPLRRMKAALGLFKKSPSNLPFYQYAFKESEFRELLHQWPFEIIHVEAMSGIKGLRDEWTMFRRWYDSSRRGIRHAIVIRLFRYAPFLEFLFGHMLVVVAQRR